MRSEEEIQSAADRVKNPHGGTTAYHGQTYEQGVRDALDWVLEDLSDIEQEG